MRPRWSHVRHFWYNTSRYKENVMTDLMNRNVQEIKPLMSPNELKVLLHATEVATQTVRDGRREIESILAGEDRRLLVIVGPCSIHDPNAAVAYARKLSRLRERFADKLCIVMRAYFEKPRTVTGWKGLINDPHLDGSFDIEKGLQIARDLLLDIAELKLPAATEFLDPITPQYIDDLISWAAIGARTTESQTHRQMASGLSMLVGYKNTTTGGIQIAIDAMNSARHPHQFLGIDNDGNNCIVSTRGNPHGHLILRGGNGTPNYHPDNVAATAQMLKRSGLDPVMVVDCSHANSNKKHEEQEVVWRSVIDQCISAGSRPIIGAMLESNLKAGKQPIPEDLSALEYGVSVTDACIGWEKTEELLAYAYDALPDPVTV